MPTRSEIKAQIDSARTSLHTLKSGIPNSKDLGQGYHASLILRNRDAGIDIGLYGPARKVNDIPHDVIIEYAKVLNKVRRWEANLEPDFPAL